MNNAIETISRESVIIDKFKYFGGKHCETTALMNVLKYYGYNFSEEMLLGLGGGVGFIYWDMKFMPAPFIGTRFGETNEFLPNVCKRIGADIKFLNTNSSEIIYDQLIEILCDDSPIIVYGDIAFLPYIAYMASEGDNFGGHTFIIFGIDEEDEKVYISNRSDRAQTITITDLIKATSSNNKTLPLNNRILKINHPLNEVNIEQEIGSAINDCCNNMLNPLINNTGLPGMKKWADTVTKWHKQFKDNNLFYCLINTYICIETGGTGGAAFRNMYASFLNECGNILNIDELEEISLMFCQSARKWHDIAAATLPDEYPITKRTRELLFEKNALFENQDNCTQASLKEINEELADIEKDVANELNILKEILPNMQKSILECLEIESEAFKRLHSLI